MGSVEFGERIVEKIKSRFAPFIVGFVIVTVVDRREKALSAGSGTLVHYKERYGILTASHVVEEINRHPEIVLVRFPLFGTKTQNLRMKTAGLKCLRLGELPFTERGPDLAFLELPGDTLDQLKANNTFLNLENRGLSDPLRKRYFHFFVVGVIAERTVLVETGNPQFAKFEASIEPGNCSQLWNSDERDYCDFEPGGNDPDYKFPRSYEGVSGGGLWRVFCSESKGVIDEIDSFDLLGVAFYQSEASESGKRTLRCHGPQSLRALFGKLDR